MVVDVTITSPTSFLIAGKNYHSSEAEPRLLERLIDALYETRYLATALSPDRPRDDDKDHDDGEFLTRLAGHNRSEDRWDGGWTVYAISTDSTLSIAKGDCCRTAVAGEFRAPEHATGAAQVEIFLPREQWTDGAPYYAVFGTTPIDAIDDADRFRVYFNITAAGAPHLMELLTERLNTFRIPFRLKFLVAPSAYGRPDACVLYVAMRYLSTTLMIVDGISREFSAELGPDIPACTLRIAPGIAVAEDTVTGESFGRHRCGIIAVGLIDAWRAGNQAIEKKIEAIEQRFAQAELSIDRPYLARSSRDLFEQFLFPETNND
jgi:hypothetical protein